MTAFALERLDIHIPDREPIPIWFDGNGKITRGGGSFSEPVPNAFSLPHIVSCPQATKTCKEFCYVHRLEAAEQDVYDHYRDNLAALQTILALPSHRRAWAANQIGDWINANCRHSGFRWHVSGDVMSQDHARFIRYIAEDCSIIYFWMYTRSFDYLLELHGLSNLVVNLSADQDNYRESLQLHRTLGFRICYMTVDGIVPDDLPKGSVIFPSHSLRGRDLDNPTDAPFWRRIDADLKKMVCPPDFFSQSEQRRCGPCKKCLRHPRSSE